MNSNWQTEIGAIFWKEVRTEFRARTGIITVGLLSLCTVVALGLAAFNLKMSGNLAAGLLWCAILFACVPSLPRSFLAEEEQGTGDLLRQWARPHAVYWGKALYNLVQGLATGTMLSVLFLGFVAMPVAIPWLFVLSLVGGTTALAGTVTLCGALVARASNRAALAGAISVPLLLPLIAIGVSSMRVSLGAGLYASGLMATVGLYGYAAFTLVVAPWLFASVWKK